MTTGFFKKYDPKTQAKWYEYQDMKFLIAPLRNPLHKKELLKNFKWEELGKIDDVGFAEAFKDQTAEFSYNKMHTINGLTLVFGWENVLDDNGKAMSFDQSLVVEKMLEDAEFGAWVQSKATDLLIERFDEKAQVVKN